MRKTHRNKRTRKAIFILIALLLFALVVQSVRIYNAVQKQIAAEKSRPDKTEIIPFEKLVLTPHHNPHIEIRQSANEARGIAAFRNSFFAATSGGLLKLDESGEKLKHYTVADGLAESDLTALAVFRDRLFIGTRSKNLLVFDGERFENYVWTDRQAQIVTSFLADENRLLIGTFAGGLIEFDGANFREIKADDARISGVNCLYEKDLRLFVGTFADGLWVFDAGVWRHFTAAETLPSNRIVGIAQTGERIFVATDFGIAEARNLDQPKPFRAVNNTATVAGITERGGEIFYAKADGEVFPLDVNSSVFKPERKSADARLAVADNRVFLLTAHGIFAADDGNRFRSFRRADADVLTDNFVSALALDAGGNLWAGTFRNGIDVFAAGGKKLEHLESEAVREINFLQNRSGEIHAATSAGLLRFGSGFSSANLTEENNLPSRSVTHFAATAETLAVASSKGLTTNENGRVRVFSTVNGLPSNSIYAVLFAENSLFAGTLGGLAEIQNKRVVRTFKDSNSKLGANWVTALARADGRIFIGTYGGGIFELTASGEIRSFAEENGKFVVNPTALFADGERLYSGTLSGVRVLDLRTQKWSVLRSELPSEAVFAVAGDDANVYFGTTGGIAKINKKYFESELKR